jgi:hypothetical protein
MTEDQLFSPGDEYMTIKREQWESILDIGYLQDSIKCDKEIRGCFIEFFRHKYSKEISLYDIDDCIKEISTLLEFAKSNHPFASISFLRKAVEEIKLNSRDLLKRAREIFRKIADMIIIPENLYGFQIEMIEYCRDSFRSDVSICDFNAIIAYAERGYLHKEFRSLTEIITREELQILVLQLSRSIYLVSYNDLKGFQLCKSIA